MKWLDAAMHALEGPRGRARLSVLIFHRVLERPDPLLPGEPTAEEFSARLVWLREHFRIVRLVDAVADLRKGSLAAHSLALTFDDGYADNWRLATPVLRELGLTATFFIATGYLDGGRMFNDTVIEAIRQAPAGPLDLSEIGLGTHVLATPESRRQVIGALLKQIKYLPEEERRRKADAIAERCGARLPDDLMMRSDDVIAMRRAGMDLGAHTVTHPILAVSDPERCRREIAASRDHLERLLGERVGLFAYPNGQPDQDYRAEHVGMVRELGFDAAVSTAWGATQPGEDLYQVPRFTPWDRAHWRFGLRLAKMRRGDTYKTAARA